MCCLTEYWLCSVAIVVVIAMFVCFCVIDVYVFACLKCVCGV